MRNSVLTTNPEPIDNFHLVYRRTITTKWQFVGYRCLNCDRVLKNDTTVPRHKENCKKHVRVYKLDPDPELVINNKREPWEPIDSNIHENTKHSLKQQNKKTAL